MLILVLLVALGQTNSSPVPKKDSNETIEGADILVPKNGNFSRFEYNTDVQENEIFNLIDFDSPDNSLLTNETVVSLICTAFSCYFKETTTISQENDTKGIETTTELLKKDAKVALDPISLDLSNSTANRTIRQEDSGESVETVTDCCSLGNPDEKESQEDEEEEEEPQNMVTGLISAFLGGLSRPDGSIDVEAITGLLGSLSVQRDDGSYDFNGLTEILQSFFGGGEDGGGSDIGAFVGGLLGAFIKGVAQPPGAPGAGRFLGSILTQVLPALSAPAPTQEGDTTPQKPVDSGGFLTGLLTQVLGSSGTLSGGSSGSKPAGGNGGYKYGLFKTIFSSFTSLFASSSHPH